jgi:hypothetical protein
VPDPARVVDPVFIVGAARSGTSILYRTLQKHPVFEPARPSLDESYVFRSLPHAWLFRSGYPTGLASFMTNPDAYRDFLRTTRARRVAGAPAGMLNELRAGRSITLWKLSLGRSLLRTYLSYARDARGCSRLIEKTPTHLPYVPHIFNAFEDATVISLHRHPVDVYSSYVRRVRADGGGGLSNFLPIGKFIDHYRAEAELAVAYDRRYSRFLAVSYESLTSAPRESLLGICRFLGVDFAPRLLADDTPDTTWEPDPYLFKPIVSQTKDWSEFISQADAWRIETALADVMTNLGYGTRA